MTDFMSINVDKLDKSSSLLKRFRWKSAAASWSARVGPILLNEIKKVTPVQTGALRDSTRVSIKGGGTELVFSSDRPYAPWVIHGTDPHEIWPKSVKMLHWVDNGGEVFAHHVSHPGTRPNPYPLMAGRRALALVGSAMAASIRSEIKP